MRFGGGPPAFRGALARQAPDLFDSAASGTALPGAATRVGAVEDVLGYAVLYGFVAVVAPGTTVNVLQGSASGIFEVADAIPTVLDPVTGLNVARWSLPVVGRFARIDVVNPGAPTTCALAAHARGVS